MGATGATGFDAASQGSCEHGADAGSIPAASTMKVGSLFSGIGGLELGLERAGMEVVWQVEKNKFCQKVLAKHWPGVKRYSDVETVGAHNLESVDLICGGFPCQDISVAGKGQGLKGERSGLWFEYARIIRELRPQYALVENVSALTIRGLDRVVGELASLGYDSEWSCIPASAVGAPHRRRRTFILAYPNGEQEHPLLFAGWYKGSQAPASGGEVDAVDSHSGGSLGSWGSEWLSEPNVGRVVDGVPNRMDRIRVLGNSVVPQVSEWIGRMIMQSA